MPKVPARMRGALNRKVSILEKQGKLKGKNLQRVMTRMDRLRGPATTTTTVPKRSTTTTTMQPKREPTKHDKMLLKQGFTREELGLD